MARCRSCDRHIPHGSYASNGHCLSCMVKSLLATRPYWWPLDKYRKHVDYYTATGRIGR